MAAIDPRGKVIRPSVKLLENTEENGTELFDTYALLLAMEAEAIESSKTAILAADKLSAHGTLLAVRSLGWAFQLSPSKTCISNKIKASLIKGKSQVITDGDDLVAGIRMFKAANYKGPEESTPTTPEFWSKAIEEMASNIEKAPPNDKVYKKAALKRDGFRCILTGKYDTAIMQVNQQARDECWRCTFTQGCHIIPRSINSPTRPNVTSAALWLILETYFGFPRELTTALNGRGIHDVQNILTLSAESHAEFDGLGWWLEPNNDAPNLYDVCGQPQFVGNPPNPATVQFTAAGDSDEAFLPNPEFLRVRGLASRVGVLSGAAEVIQFDDDDDFDTNQRIDPDQTESFMTTLLKRFYMHGIFLH